MLSVICCRLVSLAWWFGVFRLLSQTTDGSGGNLKDNHKQFTTDPSTRYRSIPKKIDHERILELYDTDSPEEFDFLKEKFVSKRYKMRDNNRFNFKNSIILGTTQEKSTKNCFQDSKEDSPRKFKGEFWLLSELQTFFDVKLQRLNRQLLEKKILMISNQRYCK